jgi:glucosyl-3-phosphoglycerate synthase
MIDKEETTKKSLHSHASFEDYKNDVGKLKKMAEQVAFTIVYQAIEYNRLEEYKKVIL